MVSCVHLHNPSLQRLRNEWAAAVIIDTVDARYMQSIWLQRRLESLKRKKKMELQSSAKIRKQVVAQPPCPLTEPQRSRYGYCNLNIAAAVHRINEPVLPPALQDSWRPWCRLPVTDSKKINWRTAAEQKSASIKINKNFPAQLARRSAR